MPILIVALNADYLARNSDGGRLPRSPLPAPASGTVLPTAVPAPVAPTRGESNWTATHRAIEAKSLPNYLSAYETLGLSELCAHQDAGFAVITTLDFVHSMKNLRFDRLPSDGLAAARPSVPDSQPLFGYTRC